jgi:hypothetical protein
VEAFQNRISVARYCELIGMLRRSANYRIYRWFQRIQQELQKRWMDSLRPEVGGSFLHDGFYNNIIKMKFITDGTLGKLARWLRILGYDTECCQSSSTQHLIERSRTEGRIILTRSRKLCQHEAKIKCILIRHDSLSEQLKQLVEQINLDVSREPFSRCVLCNCEIESVGKQDVKKLVPDLVYQNQEKFFRCPSCKKIYWRGTHLQNTLVKLSKIFSSNLIK